MIGMGLRKVNFTIERVGFFSPKVKIRVTRGYSFNCTPEDFATLQASNFPHVLGTLKGFQYWFYRGGVLKADRHYDNEEIRLLLWDKEQREQSKLGRLKEMKTAEESGTIVIRDVNRELIPEDIRAFVWRRDMGQCRKCGIKKNLQFDHVIPIAKGGASTPENLQLLCTRCNQDKRDYI